MFLKSLLYLKAISRSLYNSRSALRASLFNILRSRRSRLALLRALFVSIRDLRIVFSMIRLARRRCKVPRVSASCTLSLVSLSAFLTAFCALITFLCAFSTTRVFALEETEPEDVLTFERAFKRSMCRFLAKVERSSLFEMSVFRLTFALAFLAELFSRVFAFAFLSELFSRVFAFAFLAELFSRVFAFAFAFLVELFSFVSTSDSLSDFMFSSISSENVARFSRRPPGKSIGSRTFILARRRPIARFNSTLVLSTSISPTFFASLFITLDFVSDRNNNS